MSFNLKKSEEKDSLHSDPAKIVLFDKDYVGYHSASLTLTNTSSCKKVFKIKTNLRESLKASPIQGILNPKESIIIKLRLYSNNLGDAKLIVKHVNCKMSETDMSFDEFMATWKSLDSTRLHLLRLNLGIKTAQHSPHHSPQRPRQLLNNSINNK